MLYNWRIGSIQNDLNEVVTIRAIRQMIFVKIVFRGSFDVLLFPGCKSVVGTAVPVAGLSPYRHEHNRIPVLCDQIDFSIRAMILPGAETVSLPS